MKPRKFSKKLELNKRTVANLSHREMYGLHGGAIGNINIIPVLTTIQCITDPPTMCFTCPMTGDQPCQCGVGVEPVEIDGHEN